MFSLFWEKLSLSFDLDRVESLETLESKSMILWVLSGGLKSGNILAVESASLRLPRKPFPLPCEDCLWFCSGFANGGRMKLSCTLFPATVMSPHEYTLRLHLRCLFSPGLPNCPPTSPKHCYLLFLPRSCSDVASFLISVEMEHSASCFSLINATFLRLIFHWNTRTCSSLSRFVANLTWFHLDAGYLFTGFFCSKMTTFTTNRFSSLTYVVTASPFSNFVNPTNCRLTFTRHMHLRSE